MLCHTYNVGDTYLLIMFTLQSGYPRLFSFFSWLVYLHPTWIKYNVSPVYPVKLSPVLSNWPVPLSLHAAPSQTSTACVLWMCSLIPPLFLLWCFSKIIFQGFFSEADHTIMDSLKLIWKYCLRNLASWTSIRDTSIRSEE